MKKITCFVVGVIFLLILPWATPATAQVQPIKSFKLGLWSRQDSVWIFHLNAHQQDSTLYLASVYIPIERILRPPSYGIAGIIYYRDKGKVSGIKETELTENPVETERWKKLIIKARLGGYSYLYSFIEEIFCHTYSESAPIVMNDLFNEIMSAFAYRGQFPNSPQGVGYCIEYYT